MKSEVPSLPNCYSFILPTLSQEPGSPSATSEAEEQPGKAQRVQEPRGMMETGQPDQRVGAWREWGHNLGNSWPPRLLFQPRQASLLPDARSDGKNWRGHEGGSSPHVTSPGKSGHRDTESRCPTSLPLVSFSREDKRGSTSSWRRGLMAWFSILDSSSLICKQEKTLILTWGWGRAGNGLDSHACWDWAEIIARVKANSGRAAGRSRPPGTGFNRKLTAYSSRPSLSASHSGDRR